MGYRSKLAKPVIVPLLVVANLFALIYMGAVQGDEHWLTIRWGFTPGLLTHTLLNGPVGEFGHNLLTLVTYQFMHGGVDHFLSNMLFLILFGSVVEMAVGNIRFLAWYLVFGIGAALGHYVFNLTGDIPMIGASGAIAGLMAAFVALLITGRFRFHPIMLLGALFAIMSVLGEFASVLARPENGMNDHVAHLAHIGGFVVGFPVALVYGLKGLVRDLRARARARADENRRLEQLMLPPDNPTTRDNAGDRSWPPSLKNPPDGGDAGDDKRIV